jgi:lipopolysaccharide transport system ATP-binding protein
MSTPVLYVDKVSKKFCSHLRWSMFYGILDTLKFGLGIALPKRLRNHEFMALQDVSLELQKGEILGLLGRNGSGKTTLMRIIAGIYPADSGRVDVKGRIASLFAVTAGMNPLFTGRENIFVRGAFFGMTTREINDKLDWIIAFSELGDFIDAPMGTYSSGMRARLGYSIAVATNPDLLIVDEGLAVGDAAFRNKCFHHLREISANCGIIFISHNINQINKVANRILVLDRGEVVHRNTDVTAGIDFYMRQSGTLLEQQQSEAILGVDYPEKVAYGSPFPLQIQYSSVPLLDSVWVIQIYDSERRLVAEHESSSGLISSSGGQHTVQCVFEQIQLKPEIYYLTVGIMNRESNQYIAIYNVPEPFQVTGYFQGNAPYQMVAKWNAE